MAGFLAPLQIHLGPVGGSTTASGNSFCPLPPEPRVVGPTARPEHQLHQDPQATQFVFWFYKMLDLGSPADPTEEDSTSPDTQHSQASSVTRNLECHPFWCRTGVLYEGKRFTQVRGAENKAGTNS